MEETCLPSNEAGRAGECGQRGMLTGKPGEEAEGKAAKLAQDVQKDMRAAAGAIVWVKPPPTS